MTQLIQDESWDHDIPKTNIQLDPMAPKKLLKVVALLKKQQISTLKMKFSFLSEFDRKVFNQLMKQEENDEYFREEGKEKNNIYSVKLKRKQMGSKENGFIFEIGSRLKSEIFMRAYRGNKLEELERNCNIKVNQLGRDIYIQSDSKVWRGSIVHSELLDMYKRLKHYIFFNQEKLWNVVTNSEEFKKKLQKIGIYSYTNLGKRKHVAFYSFECEPEEIRKHILRENSFEPRVLKLEDNELPSKDNVRIFDVVVRSVRPTIDLIRNSYEANLEVNKNNCCFVLHLKHEVFAEEPVAEIAKTVSNLFILSFPLRNSRSFINELKRNQKKYQFINATHYGKTTFCCIDRTKVKNKKDIMSIFAPFLEGLERDSKLTLHLRPNCVLQQNSTVPSQVLDLAQKFKLDVEDYEKILNREKFNIVIKPKNFNKEQKKSQKQLQFSKFLVQLLTLSQNQTELTEDDLNESMLNNSLVTQNTDESDRKKNQRGNRGKGRSKQRQQFQQKEKKKQVKQITEVANEKSEKQEIKGRGNRGNRGNREERGRDGSIVEIQASVENVEAKNLDLSKHPIIKQMADMADCDLEVQFHKPSHLDENQLFKRWKKDREIQETIENKEGIKVRCWSLKVNAGKCGLPQNYEQYLIKEKCFLVQRIPYKEEELAEFDLKFRKLNSLQDQQEGYLIYKSPDGKVWVPTHLIQKFE